MGLLVGGLSVCPTQGPCQPAASLPHMLAGFQVLGLKSGAENSLTLGLHFAKAF